jgi:hypothetical protein
MPEAFFLTYLLLSLVKLYPLYGISLLELLEQFRYTLGEV